MIKKLKITNLSRGKKRLLGAVSLLLVVSIIVSLMSNMVFATNKSLNYIEELKKTYSTGSFKVLEIAPTITSGTIGYYVDGSEPISNWAEDTAGFQTNTVRESYVSNLATALKNKGLLNDKNDNSTPLRQGSKYEEWYPWEKIGEKLITKEMRDNSKHGYKTMDLASMEKVKNVDGTMSIGTFYSAGTYMSATVSSLDTSIDYYVKNSDNTYDIVTDFKTVADGTELFKVKRYDSEYYEYDAVMNYKLATSSNLNYFDYSEWYKNITVALKGKELKESQFYTTTKILQPGKNGAETITVFGSTQKNWEGKTGTFYDLNSIYSSGDYYTVEVGAGSSYTLNFHVNVSGKAQITVVPLDQDGNTIIWKPNYSKNYWYVNEYINKTGDYSYTFSTSPDSSVAAVAIKFDVADLTSSATFSDITLNKFETNYFNFPTWASSSENTNALEGSVGTTKVTTDIISRKLTLRMKSGKQFNTNYSGTGKTKNGLTYRMECTALKTYDLTYHVENSMDDGGKSVIQVLGYDADGNPVKQNGLSTNVCNVNSTTTSKSGTFSFKFTPASGTAYLVISFGISSNNKKNISHTAVFSDIFLGKVGEYQQTEAPTHVQNIDYFKYGQQDSLLGDNIFNIGEWNSTLYSNDTNHPDQGTVSVGITNQVVSITRNGGQVESFTRYSWNTERCDGFSAFYYMPVQSGMKYKVSYYVDNSLETSKSQFWVFFYDQYGKYVGASIAKSNFVNDSGNQSFDFTVPSGCGFIQIRLGCQASTSDISKPQECTFKNISIRPYDQKAYYYAVKETPMTQYILEGNIGCVGFEKQNGVSYFKADGTAFDFATSKIGDEVFIKNDEGYLEQTGSIGYVGFVPESGTSYFVKGADDKYTAITDFDKLVYGTDIYSYFFSKPIYHKDTDTGIYTYAGQVSKEFTYAGTYGQDEFVPDDNITYYVYDNVNYVYNEADRTKLSTGDMLFIEDVKFEGANGNDYLIEGETYVFLSVDYEVNPPVSSVFEAGKYEYCCTSTDFRPAGEDETPYFIEDGVDYYKYVGSGNGAYRFTPGTGEIITVATDEVFYVGGFINNNWFLKYVFDYETVDASSMKVSVDTITPQYLCNKTEEDMESYLAKYELIVISPGLDVLQSVQFESDLTKKGYDILYDVITGADYQIPCMIDRSIKDISYEDSEGDAIVYLPRLANALCSEITTDNYGFTGGVKDQIYEFSYSDLGVSPGEDNAGNESVANKYFNKIFLKCENDDGSYVTNIVGFADENSTHPYYEVFQEIVYEKKIDLAVTVKANISEAACIRCILNYRGRLRENRKSVIRILDIEPYTSNPARENSKFKKFLVNISFKGKEYNTASGLTPEEVRSWFKDDQLKYTDEKGDKKDTKIEIVTMAVAEFNGINEDLIESYDVLYVGASLTNMNYRLFGDGEHDTDSIWEKNADGSDTLDTNGNRIENSEYGETLIPHYNDTEMDGMYYTNVGDLYYVKNATMVQSGAHRTQSELGGLLLSEYYFNPRPMLGVALGGRWELRADNYSLAGTNSRANLQVRTSGNDITDNKLSEIKEFAEAGHPIIINGNLCDNGWVSEGTLSCEIKGTIVKQTEGATARIVATYTGKQLPSGVYPQYTWYENDVELKESDARYKKYVSYSDVNNDGIDECIFEFPIDIKDAENAVYKTTYYCQISSFKFGAGRYRSLSNFTKPTSNKVKINPNTTKYEVTISHTGNNTAKAELKIVEGEDRFKKIDPNSATINDYSYTINLNDDDNTTLYYEWRTLRKVITSVGSWETGFYKDTKYKVSSKTIEFEFNFKDWGLGTHFGYVDMRLDYASKTFGSTSMFTEAKENYCSYLAKGESQKYSKSINYPSFVDLKGAISGVKGTDDFRVRTERVDNSSKMYSALVTEIGNTSAFVYSTETLKMISNNNTEAVRLLNAVNVSKPTIVANQLVNSDNTPITLDVYDSDNDVTKWDSNNVIEVTGNMIQFDFSINNPTDNQVRHTKYNYYVYIDKDADGNYDESELLKSGYEVLDITNSPSTAEQGTLKSCYTNENDPDHPIQYKYRLQIGVGGDYVGILPWKLKIVSTKDDDVHDSFCGYAYNRPQNRYEIDVLQVLPMTVKEETPRSSERWYKVHTWSTALDSFVASTAGEKQSLFLSNAFSNLGKDYQREIVHDSTNGDYIKFTIGSDYILNIHVTSVYELQNYKNGKEYYIEKNGDDKELDDGCCRTTKEIFDYFNKYDMLIIGFGDSYAKGISENVAQAISDYIDTGKHVLYTHDTTDQFNNFYPALRQGTGYYLNLYVRDKVGMDKYGITNSILSHSQASRNSASVSKSNDPSKYGYTDNIYTNPSLIYYYDDTPVEYKYWKPTVEGTYDGENGAYNYCYMAAEKTESNKITATNRYPAIINKLTEGGEDVWKIQLEEDTGLPTKIIDYRVDTDGRIIFDEDVINTYGEGNATCRGVLIYYENGTWNIAKDSNGQFVYYSENIVEGWVQGYDDGGHVITTSNIVPYDLEREVLVDPETKTPKVDIYGNYQYGEWTIKTVLGIPDKTSDIYKNSYGIVKQKELINGKYYEDCETLIHGAYVTYDTATKTYSIGKDARGNPIIYGQNAYDVDDPDGSPSIRVSDSEDQTELMSRSISQFKDLGYQISYRVNTHCAEVATEVHGFTTYAMTRYKRSYKNDQVQPTAATYIGNDITETKEISQVNKGQITLYPFNLTTDDFKDISYSSDKVVSRGKTLPINTTHEQYYTLDLTGALQDDGTYSDDFATVWYCLAGDGYANNVYNDCSNAYYLYSYKNVIYTGAGHTNDMSTAEAKLFINIIVASHIKSGSSAEVELQDSEGKSLNNIVMRSTTEEYVNDENETVSKGVPDVGESERKLTIHLSNVQNDSYLEIYYMNGENYEEIMYDSNGKPHIVTYDKDLFIIAVDGNAAQITTNGNKETRTFIDNTGVTRTATYTTTTSTVTVKENDGSTTVKTISTKTLDYIYEPTGKGYDEILEVSGLYRIRQNLTYSMTVYDSSGTKVVVVRDGYNNIISIDGDTSRNSINGMELYYDKNGYTKVANKEEMIDKAITRPILEYDISYTIPEDVYKYLAASGDKANLSLTFIVMPIINKDGVKTIGDESVPDVINIVKLGYKELI